MKRLVPPCCSGVAGIAGDLIPPCCSGVAGIAGDLIPPCCSGVAGIAGDLIPPCCSGVAGIAGDLIPPCCSGVAGIAGDLIPPCCSGVAGIAGDLIPPCCPVCCVVLTQPRLCQLYLYCTHLSSFGLASLYFFFLLCPHLPFFSLCAPLSSSSHHFNSRFSVLFLDAWSWTTLVVPLMCSCWILSLLVTPNNTVLHAWPVLNAATRIHFSHR